MRTILIVSLAVVLPAVWLLLPRDREAPVEPVASAPANPTAAVAAEPATAASAAPRAALREPVAAPRAESSGATVRGVVADQAGRAIPGVAMTLSLGKSGLLLAKSATDGSFEFRRGAAPGGWKLRVHAPYVLIRPERVTVAHADQDVCLEVVVRPPEDPDAVSGVVTEEDGTPVPCLGIRTGYHSMHKVWYGASAAAHTDERGRFVIRRTDPDFEKIWLQPDASASCSFEPIDWGGYAWGTSDLRLRVRPGARVVLTVVETGSGRPVERYGVRCLRDPDGETLYPRKIEHDGRHEHGKLELGVDAGRGAVLVYPTDGVHAPSACTCFVAAPRGSLALRVEVQRRADLRVEVVTRAQAPLSGACLRLLRWEGDGPLTLATPTLATDGGWPEFARFERPRGTATILAAGSTDERGRATLRGPPSEGTLALEVLGPGCTPTLFERVVLLPGPASLRLEVAVGASLRGRFVPAGLLDELCAPAAKRPWPKLILRVGGVPPLEIPVDDPSGYRVARDGTFRIENLPPGDVTPVVRWWTNTLEQDCSESRALGPILALRDGETRDVELDVSALAPVRLHGRVTVNGAPLEHGRLDLVQSLPGASGGREHVGHLGQITTDAAGRYEAWLSPCEVKVEAWLEDTRRLPGADWVSVAAGAEREADFALVRRKVTVRVLEADGARPATGREFLLQSDCSHDEPLLAADEDGLVLVDPAPQRFHLVALAPGMTRAQRARLPDPKVLAEVGVRLDPLEVPVGRTEAHFERRLQGAR